MRILRKSTEDEMICEFLKAEYFSERFAEQLKKVMREFSVDEHIIMSADLHSSDENAQRKNILGEFRGYGLNREMFERFPTDIEWNLCDFSSDDFIKIRYINYSYWNELSAGTHSPLTAAERIRIGISIYEKNNDGFIRTAEYIKNGGVFSKMIFLTSDFESFVIVEGHLRMTAYALVPEYFNQIEVIVGRCKSDELKNWM